MAVLVGGLVLGGCRLTRWAIHKYGETQYMSYQIDARNLALYTFPRARFEYSVEDIDAALAAVGGRAAAAKQPLVIFIHGRGKHPEKAFGDHPQIGRDILGQMTDYYQAAVLMVHWPSWLGPSGYPSLNARETGPHLQLLFDGMRRYRETRRGDKSPPVTLFVHSMGNQVLASFLETYGGEFQGKAPLFDTLILNAPDADLKDHHHWVERIDFAARIYVLVNSGKDRMLQLSGYLQANARLGRQLVHDDDTPEPLAVNAEYVDLIKLGVNHDYFYGEALPEALVDFYRRAFSSGADPMKTPGMTPGPYPRLYLLQSP
jgi:esterase/lipase superfamily enzyme